MHKEPSLEVKNVTVVLAGRPVLEGVSFSVEGPGLVQILGPNGAGKTTLLKTIVGLVRPRRGRILLCGVDVTGNPRLATRYAAYLPQLPPSMHGYPLTPLELLSFTGVDEGRARAALRQLGIDEEYWGTPIDRLSAGLRQRVFIAQAIARDTPIVLLDEPLSSIDPAARAELADTLRGLAEERLLLITSHDPAILLPYTRLLILLKRRVYAAGPPREVLTLENARKVYGRAALLLGGHLHIADSH